VTRAEQLSSHRSPRSPCPSTGRTARPASVPSTSPRPPARSVRATSPAPSARPPRRTSRWRLPP